MCSVEVLLISPKVTLLHLPQPVCARKAARPTMPTLKSVNNH